MVEQDFNFIPFSDAAISDLELIGQHKELIKSHSYTDATDLLDNANYTKGFRASVFNNMRNKMQKIATYLLSKTIEPDDLYSTEMPSEDQMANKQYWVQPF